MLDSKIIIAIIGSSVLAALVTAIFSRIQHSKSITVRYVTEEREKWRESLKLAMSELSELVSLPDNDADKLKTVRKKATYIKLCLNPNPKHSTDSSALGKLDEICDSPSYESFKELEKGVQLILKHDWERVKLETQTIHLTFIYFLVTISSIYGAISFYFKDSAIYKNLQGIESLSGLYSEMFFSLVSFAIGLYLVSIIYNAFNKRRLKIK